MDALQLADEVESEIYCQEAAAMLRQQYAEIQLLKELLNKFGITVEKKAQDGHKN